MKKSLILSVILSSISINAFSNNLNMSVEKPIYVGQIESFEKHNIFKEKKDNIDSKIFFKTKATINKKEYNVSYGFIGMNHKIINVRDISGSEELLKNQLKIDKISYDDFVNELDKKVKELKVTFVPGKQIGLVDGYDEKNPKQIIGQNIYDGKIVIGNMMGQYEVNVGYIISDKKELKVSWVGSASTGKKDELMINRLKKEGYTEEMLSKEIDKKLREINKIV